MIIIFGTNNPSAKYEKSKFVLETITYISKKCSQDIIYVFEQTPHIDYDENYFTEGYKWLKDNID